MSDTFKFWLQALIIPAVLAWVGYNINSTLQNNQRAFDKIKFTDQVLNEAFDAEHADKAFALAEMLPFVVDDTALAGRLSRLIYDHFTNEGIMAAKSGNDSVFAAISQAAKAYEGSQTVVQSLENNPTTKKVIEASELEQKGLEQIRQGKLEQASESFTKAEQVYPGFHSTYEISNLLKDKVSDVKQGADPVKAKQDVIKEIKTNYSWKLNVATLKR